MGHQRLGMLPRTLKWQAVVDLISGGADVSSIASEVSAAAERSTEMAANDPGASVALHTLTQVLLAARTDQFVPELRRLGLMVGNEPSLLEVTSALANAIDGQVRELGGRTDLGEMAKLAVVESLNAVAGRELNTLFGTTTDDVRRTFAGLATVKQFGLLTTDVFARLTRRQLDYFLSRELPRHVGASSRFHTLKEHHEFNRALDTHCRETARIVREFSGEWFSKHTYEGGITREKARGFVHVAFDKIRKELSQRREADGRTPRGVWRPAGNQA